MNATHVMKLAGIAVLFLVINVAISYLMVAVYSHLINPGQTQAFYESFAQKYAPYSSIIAGMPVLFFMVWRFCRRYNLQLARHSALGIWGIYSLIDLTIVFAAGVAGKLAVLVAISTITKLAAAWLGASMGVRNEASVNEIKDTSLQT